MAKGRQGSNASHGGEGSGIVGFQRVTTGKDHIPTPSDLTVSVQVKDREENDTTPDVRYDAMQLALLAKLRGREELEERIIFFSQLKPSSPLSGREVDLMNDACENNMPDMVNVNAGRNAIEYAKRDGEFASDMREVFIDSQTGGLRPGVVESTGNFATSELGMFHEMYLVQRDNPEWKPLYKMTCALYQYIHSREKTSPVKSTYPGGGTWLRLDEEAKRLGVKWPDANSSDSDEMRVDTALAEGWWGPNAG